MRININEYNNMYMNFTTDNFNHDILVIAVDQANTCNRERMQNAINHVVSNKLDQIMKSYNIFNDDWGFEREYLTDEKQSFINRINDNEDLIVMYVFLNTETEHAHAEFDTINTNNDDEFNELVDLWFTGYIEGVADVIDNNDLRDEDLLMSFADNRKVKREYIMGYHSGVCAGITDKQ